MIVALKIIVIWIELGFAVALIVGPMLKFNDGRN